MPAEIPIPSVAREKKLPKDQVAIVQREYDDGDSISTVTSIYNGGEDPNFTTDRKGNAEIVQKTILNPGEYTIIDDTPLSALSRKLEKAFIIINKKGRAARKRFSVRKENKLLNKGFSYIPSGSFSPNP
ncbi:hypothetical protein A3F29_04050 [Candidatus Roizmanbacteria bacterium RIFCSPHIGHO2_12_FULL_33_9]|uniref:Uncharacterized protein n=1 Tax=Candidatus Roizmanbacteria bacterium RIFCSPHIGHO2_12_FULL_33_9 TaxID=1802045 RepID=A0A1F7HL28_9BACT|nr:MAG: hypothetical protein A3F29_04050 [Candidatus Roizmanbacteria bacterium RIFCSPHIGHO2_12_FULL_33_9]